MGLYSSHKGRMPRLGKVWMRASRKAQIIVVPLEEHLATEFDSHLRAVATEHFESCEFCKASLDALAALTGSAGAVASLLKALREG